MADEQQNKSNGYLEEAYRPPMLVTLVFVVTMLAIYFMGRSVSGFYDNVPEPERIAQVRL